MKSYAIVRKPIPTNTSVQHLFKLQKRDPQIEIENIQENSILIPRRKEKQISTHLIDRKSIHFIIDENLTEVNRTSNQMGRSSKSPSRKYPIFQTRLFGKESDKLINKDNLLVELINNQKNKQTPAFSNRESIVSNKSESKDHQKVNYQIKQPVNTPQKEKQPKQFLSPYDILNASFGGRQQNLIRPFPRRNTIFGQNTRVSLSKNKNLKSEIHQSQHQRSTQEKQKQKVHQKPQNLKIQKQPPTLNQINVHQNANSSRQAKIDYQKEQVSIGCCGQEVQRLNDKPQKLNRTSYTNNNEKDNFINSNSGYSIRNSIVESFFPNSSAKKQHPFPQTQFPNDFNPEKSITLNKSNSNYKDDKISSKPIIKENNKQQWKNSDLAKSLTVTIFQITSLKPFQF